MRIRHPGDRRIWSASLLALAVGIVVQGIRAKSMGWYPTGDDGYWAITVRSVFSSHPPLVGSSSSGGIGDVSGFSHLGPLGFYALAPFVAAFGGVGLAVGSAVLNACWATTAALAVRRGVGPAAGWLVACGGAALAWAMGSEVLVDPFNPHLATFALWCGLCCTWSVLTGRTASAVPAIVAASFAAQTHLSMVPIAALLGVAAIAATVRDDWRRPSTGSRLRDARWTRSATAAFVLVALWTPPAVQQLWGSGPGNLSKALFGSTDQGPVIGVRRAAGVISQPIPWPLHWTPGNWLPILRSLSDPWPVGGAVAAVAVSAAVTALAWRRRSWRTLVVACSTGALVVVGVLEASRVPIRFESIPMWNLRWTWPLALFVQAVLVSAAVGLAVDPLRSSRVVERVRGVVPLLGCAAVVTLTILNVPWRDEGSGATVAVRDPVRRALAGAGPELAGQRYFVPVTADAVHRDWLPAVLFWLDEHDVDFSISDPLVLRQTGPGRSIDGGETMTLLVRGGAAVLDPLPEGYRELSRDVPLSAPDAAWYRATTDSIADSLPSFLARVSEDPDLAARALTTPGATPGGIDTLRALSPRDLLCGFGTTIRVDADDVTTAVIGTGPRLRWCALGAALEAEAVSIATGPPPT